MHRSRSAAPEQSRRGAGSIRRARPTSGGSIRRPSSGCGRRRGPIPIPPTRCTMPSSCSASSPNTRCGRRSAFRGGRDGREQGLAANGPAPNHRSGDVRPPAAGPGERGKRSRPRPVTRWRESAGGGDESHPGGGEPVPRFRVGGSANRTPGDPDPRPAGPDGSWVPVRARPHSGSPRSACSTCGRHGRTAPSDSTRLPAPCRPPPRRTRSESSCETGSEDSGR